MRPGAGELLPRDDDFRDAVLGQELAESGPLIEKILNDPVGKYALNREGLGELHLDVVAVSDVKAAVGRLFRLLAGVEEGKDLAAVVQRRVEMLDDGGDERLGQVIECRPEQDDVVHATAEVQGLREVTLGVVDGLFVVVQASLPGTGASLGGKICEKDAVAEAGEVIDVGG